jgi:beta-barrel assembly-enhancing protease
MNLSPRQNFASTMMSRALPMQSRPQGRSLNLRLIIGLGVAAFSLFSYFRSASVNTVTGEKQYVKISAQQEIALGLQSVPQMIQQYGGETTDANARALVERVGRRLAALPVIAQSGYPFEFHALADEQTINAFALPGGPTFITMALLRRLETEGQLAGVLGHEIGHVVARHGAEHLAKQELTQGLTGAAVMATYDPSDPKTMATGPVAMMIGNMLNMKYGRDDELESDAIGVKLISEAGYDPRGMIRVMEILGEASGGAARKAEFMSTHPNPENRIGRIKEHIARQFPQGIPEGLKP